MIEPVQNFQSLLGTFNLMVAAYQVSQYTCL